MTEGVEFRRIDALERQVANLEFKNNHLREALAYYANATTVASWGYQELADDGDLARRVLGLPEPDAHELAMHLGTACSCAVCEAERTALMDDEITLEDQTED